MEIRKAPDSGTNSTRASEAPSVGSSSAYFITDMDFADLAISLLSTILELEDVKALSDKFEASRNTGSIGRPVETLMDILQYNKIYLYPLLLSLRNRELKFKLILKCFVTHATGKTQDEQREISTAKELFDYVSNVKALHKSFYPHELLFLLAMAFQVFLDTHGRSDDAILKEVCKSFQATMLDVTMDNNQMHNTARSAMVIADALLGT